MERRYLTPAEVAERLRVSSDTVLRMVERGELPALRVSRRIYRIPVPAVERYERGPVKRRKVVYRHTAEVEDYGEGESIPRAPSATVRA